MTKDNLLKPIIGDSFSDDPDHTMAAREFYAKFWGNTLSGSVNDYNGVLGSYRGETIVTFNTVAGCMIRLVIVDEGGYKMPKTSVERLEIILGLSDIPQNIKDAFQRFYDRYHSLANFMPLIRGEKHINLVKGAQPYHDFPDWFFADLMRRKPEKLFTDTINLDYFRKFGTWKNFVEYNYLQPLFEDASYSNCTLLMPKDAKLPYRVKMNRANMQDAQKHIEHFLSKATGVIEARAELLAKAGPIKETSGVFEELFYLV